MRVGVVGGGLAGALLAWRLRTAEPMATVDVYTARSRNTGAADATGASGGLVRGFADTVADSRLAAESLVELATDTRLREAAGYREVGSVYLRPAGAAPSRSIQLVDELLPGSVRVLTGAELLRYPFRDLRDGTSAVVERRAGYLSPAALRAAALGWLADGGAAIRSVPVVGVEPYPSLRLADRRTADYDLVVIAAGAWTPALLATSGLTAEGLDTKQIQYALYAGRPAGIGAFVDGDTGLYGRPFGAHGFLLGLPCERWRVDPAYLRLDTELVARTAKTATRLLGWPSAQDRPHRTVVSSDCYHDQPGLALREVAPGAPVLTFTGGSGGAAKTVLAASRNAATALLTR